MSYSLTNVATADGYVAAQSGGAELLCPQAAIVVLSIANAAVYAQFGLGIGPPNYEETQHPLLPGIWTFPRRLQPALDAVRCKSLAAGTPARVSISAF